MERLPEPHISAPESEKEETPLTLISSTHYEEDSSVEFDEYLRSHPFTQARQDSLSEPTKSKVVFSSWHVPCHTILVRNAQNEVQAFHIQPNKFSVSQLTPEQEKALEKLGSQTSSAIAVKGPASWFNTPDVKELEDFGIRLEGVIGVEELGHWRLLYDPASNELWIDVRASHSLRKYTGFPGQA